MNEAKTRYEIMAGDVMDKVEDLCVMIYWQGYEDATAEQYEAGYEAGFAAGKRRTLEWVLKRMEAIDEQDD